MAGHYIDDGPDGPMDDRGTLVVFNVRGCMTGDKDTDFEIKLLRVICTHIISKLPWPFMTSDIIDTALRRRLVTLCSRRKIALGRLDSTISNVVKCFDKALGIIPHQFLGSVMFCPERQELQFIAQGTFYDDDVEGVAFFDTKTDIVRSIKIKSISCPKTIARLRAESETKLTKMEYLRDTGELDL